METVSCFLRRVETTHVVWYNTHTCNKDVENIFKTLMLQFLKLKSSSMTFWTSTEADFRITYLKIEQENKFCLLYITIVYLPIPGT